jgi:hypothetical protein
MTNRNVWQRRNCIGRMSTRNHKKLRLTEMNRNWCWFLGVVAHTCNYSTQEAEATGSQVWGQPWIHSETLLRKRERERKERTNFWLMAKHVVAQKVKKVKEMTAAEKYEE